MSCPASYIARASLVHPVCGRGFVSLLNVRKCQCRLSNLLNHHSGLFVFTVQSRTLMRKHDRMDILGRPFNVKSEHKKDGIPQDYKIIFGTPMLTIYKYHLPLMYCIVIFVFGFGLCNVIYLEYFKEKEKHVKRFLKDEKRVVSYLAVVMGTFLSGVVLFYTRNLLLRLYYNKSRNDFIAVISKYGLYNCKIKVKPGDVRVLPGNELSGKIEVQGMRLTCHEEDFLSLDEYNIFMGYTKSQPVRDDTDFKGQKTVLDFRKRVESPEFVKKSEQIRKS